VKNLISILLALILLPLAAGCDTVTEPPPEATATSPPSAPPPTDTTAPEPTDTLIPLPSPTPTAEPVTIEGTVLRVALSARVMVLREPAEGFDTVALVEGSEVLSVEGQAAALQDVPPGMTVRATGRPGEPGALLADRVRMLGGVERVEFEPGATSAGVSGHLDADASQRYVVRAQAGQTMKVTALPPVDELLLGIWAGDGTLLKRKGDGAPSWVGRLPATQDYVVEVAAAGKGVDYQLGIMIPIRVQFEPGETSATLSGEIGEHEVHHYVLWAEAGQTMEVAVTAPKKIGLTIVGEDGIPLKRYVDEETTWRSELPVTQEYFIEVVSIEATGYELSVSIPSQADGPSIQVLSPGPGETWVEGRTYDVVWRATGVAQVDIGVALGGKDKGLIAQGLDAAAGRYTWTVPDGFVSGFGVAESSGRVMVSESGDPAIRGENEGDLTFSAPRITFEPGATSAVIDARSGAWYALEAMAGQSLYATVAPQDQVSLDVAGGELWLSSEGAPFAALSYLPETRDYLIHPMAEDGGSRVLKVAVEPLGVAPTRITFESGARLATVSGALAAGGDHAGYVLRTSAGQMVAVEVEPMGWPGGIWLRGEDGAVWATRFGESSLTAKLPTEGETFIALLTPPGAAAVEYGMTVELTP
jgi:hypothetical protein